MVATTSNKGYIQPANSSYVGTWDQPLNTNFGVLDTNLGGVATISLNNTNVTLSAPQYQCNFITFQSTLTGSVTITFPAVGSFYTIQNLCTGTSAYTITLATTAAGSQVICCPPNEAFDIMTDGTNVKYRNFGRVGSYITIATASVPNWIIGCTYNPYLNCDGSAFSSASYPALASYLGGTTLPDARGRAVYGLNQGSGRINSSLSGVNGDSLIASGGAETVTLIESQMPVHTHGVTDAGHTHTMNNATSVIRNIVGGGPAVNLAGTSITNSAITAASAVTGISINNAGGSGAHNNVPPIIMGGVTMIRAG